MANTFTSHRDNATHYDTAFSINYGMHIHATSGCCYQPLLYFSCLQQVSPLTIDPTSLSQLTVQYPLPPLLSN